MITIILYNIVTFINVLLVLLPVLLSVAFMTIIERKQLAAMQRRVGPNSVGIWGVLQPFSDAIKLILKENLIPAQSNKIIFYLAPVASLIFSLLGWGIIPFGEGLCLSDFSLGILYTLALSSCGVYGILFAGWSANSKYAFLGSLRSTAAMISYELILSSAILIIIIVAGSLNFLSLIEFQQAVWLISPLISVFLFYFISILAETSRTPFDLQEAESELVGGFFTEHSSVPFVFFFLSEYSSIVLFSTLTAIFFLGGFNLPEIFVNDSTGFLNLQSFILAIKTCLFCFLFVWFRATLPRLRYDQLIELCWLYLLPLIIALIILVPSFIINFDMFIFLIDYVISGLHLNPFNISNNLIFTSSLLLISRKNVLCVISNKCSVIINPHYPLLWATPPSALSKISIRRNSSQPSQREEFLPIAKKNNIKKIFLTIVSLIFLVSIFYYFIISLDYYKFYGIIISFAVSYLISSFVFNKFKFSNNIFVRLLQKFLLYNLIVIVGISICYYFNINIIPEASCAGDNTNNQVKMSDSNVSSSESKISAIVKNEEGKEFYEFKGDKKAVDRFVGGVMEAGKVIAEKVVPNIATGFAAGTTAAAVAKSTSGMPPVQRVALIAATGGATAAAVQIGNKVGSDIAKNMDLTRAIKNSKHGDSNIDRIPSPDENMFNCPLEGNEETIPLLTLIQSLFSLNILELLLIVILLLILFNKYIYKLNIKFITQLVNKYLPNKFTVWYNKYTKNSIEYSNKFTSIMFIFVSILFILVKLGNLYVTAELNNNIDDYVLVYNHLKNVKKGAIFLIITLNSIKNVSGFAAAPTFVKANILQVYYRFVNFSGSAFGLATQPSFPMGGSASFLMTQSFILRCAIAARLAIKNLFNLFKRLLLLIFLNAFFVSIFGLSFVVLKQFKLHVQTKGVIYAVFFLIFRLLITSIVASFAIVLSYLLLSLLIDIFPFLNWLYTLFFDMYCYLETFYISVISFFYRSSGSGSAATVGLNFKALRSAEDLNSYIIHSVNEDDSSTVMPKGGSDTVIDEYASTRNPLMQASISRPDAGTLESRFNASEAGDQRSRYFNEMSSRIVDQTRDTLVQTFMSLNNCLTGDHSIEEDRKESMLNLYNSLRWDQQETLRRDTITRSLVKDLKKFENS